MGDGAVNPLIGGDGGGLLQAIEVIAEPSDLSDQLSLYKHTDQGLSLGVEGPVTWHEIESRHLDEPH